VRDLSEVEGTAGGSGSESGSSSAPASSAPSGDASEDGGYAYASDVSAHRLVGADVCEIAGLVGGDSIDFEAAEAVYRDGRNSVNSDGTMRTLAGFAVAADRKHGLNAYYDTPTPLDEWVSGALAGTGRFAGQDEAARAEAVEKGVQNQILVAWMIHELESAMAKAADGNFDPASGAVHNWDEAWAYYHGANPQCAPYSTADKRAGNFGTTGSGETALANEAILEAMNTGRDALIGGDTDSARESADEVIRNLFITYSQASVRYASLVVEDLGESDTASASKHRAEGLAFFRVIEAIAASAGADVDSINAVYDPAAELGETGDGDTVRAALQPAWDTLGITADDIGYLD